MVLLVAHFLHPFDYLAVECFGYCDVRHGGGRRCAMPVSLVGWTPDDVARSYFNFWPALALDPTTSRSDDEGLSERMEMPGCARAGFECNDGAAGAGGRLALKR